MLKIPQELGCLFYEGQHPISGEQVKIKWSEFTQNELLAIYDSHPSNIQIFDLSSDVEAARKAAVKEQPKNVNTTAPSTTGRTIHTTAKAEGTSQE